MNLILIIVGFVAIVAALGVVVVAVVVGKWSDEEMDRIMKQKEIKR
jgi:hypothetical protein